MISKNFETPCTYVFKYNLIFQLLLLSPVFFVPHLLWINKLVNWLLMSIQAPCLRPYLEIVIQT